MFENNAQENSVYENAIKKIILKDKPQNAPYYF